MAEKNLSGKLVTLVLLLAVAMSASPVSAQSSGTEYPLVGRSRVELTLGAWAKPGGSETIATGFGSVETRMGGMAGGLAFVHHLSEDLAMSVSAEGLLAELTTRTSIGGVETSNSSVSPVMVGVRYYWPRASFGTKVRPFVSAALGSVIGNESETTVGMQVLVESRTEVAMGGRLGIGVDFVISRHFMIGMHSGYNLMSDFSQSVGGRKNYSGAQINLGFSYAFGGGR